MNIYRHLLSCSFIATLAIVGFAADVPLGVVEQVGDVISVRFDSAARIEPGSMVAIYGPGMVEKHPLTKETIIERRQLIAKAQILLVDGSLCQARLTWESAVAAAPGCDVVPLPNEAAPNAAPTITAKSVTAQAVIGATVSVPLSLIDPDGDNLGFSWSITGPAGQVGVLSARTGTVPTIQWTAPGIPCQALISVTARDPLGQTFSTDIAVVANAEADWRTRELKNFARYGSDFQPAATRLSRDDVGQWWTITDSGTVMRFSSGWRNSGEMAFATDKTPRSPITLRPVHDEMYILTSTGIAVYGRDGTPRRNFGMVQKPTDFVVSSDGTTFIADQGAGGVLVYEKDGSFRARLGQAGTSDDAFGELTRLALDRHDVLYALDVKNVRVHRFDRHHHRLASWSIQTDQRNLPVDLAPHPRGLLVLLASGAIQIFNDKGLASESWKNLADAHLVERCDEANALYVDRSEEVFVTYPRQGFIARYSADGRITGARGASLWTQSTFVADGRGNIFGLDSNAHISEFDYEGWLVARFGGLDRDGGPFESPIAMAICPDGNALAVLDSDKKAVIRFPLDGDRSKPLAFGQAGKNFGQFVKPIALCMDAAGRTYVLDAKLRRVQAFNAKGSYMFTFGHYDRGDKPDELIDPTVLTVAPNADAVYVYDYDTYEIKKFALDFAKAQAVHVNNTGGKGDDPGQFRKVIALGCDRRGLLYAWDTNRSDLQVLDFRGSNAVAGKPRTLGDLGISRVALVAVAPDGQVFLGGKGSVVGWGW